MAKKYKGQIIFQKVYWELIQAAQYRGYVTYQEIAQIMNLPLTGSYMGSQVGQIIGEISEEEHKRGRPMLSAIVVGISGSPGEGFFALAKILGYQFEESSSGKRKFWEDERQKVYSTFQRELKK